MKEKMYNVGKIVNTHGLKGEVRVISRTDFPKERYRPGNKLYFFAKDSEIPEEIAVKSHRRHKTFDLLTFEDKTTIQDVEKMKGGILKVKESALMPLEENAFYFHEIIGSVVTSTDGKKIGTVTEIMQPGANDVWIVKAENKKEYYIPYIEDVVKKIDPIKKEISIELIEGLLDE